MSDNYLTGQLPNQIGNLNKLTYLDLSRNNLSGPLSPSVLVLLSNYLYTSINLSHNSFSGVPPSFDNDMQPHSFSIDFSYNNLQFPLDYEYIFPPKALIGNKGFLVPENPNNHKKWLFKILLISLVVIILVPLLLFIFIRFRRNSMRRDVELNPQSTIKLTSSNVFSIWNFDGKAVFEDIIEAIENFDDKYCFGVSGSGSMYEVELPTGQVVAVKKFHQSQNVESINSTSFQNEIRVLTEIRHRNIVKLYGFCSHTQHTFMVYEYMEKGRLSSILSNNSRAVKLDWKRRIQTVQGIADALCYMHHDCNPPIVHRDITSNNILFDSEFKACISDFGTAKVLNLYTSSWTNAAGTCKYIAPEFAYTKKVTEKCDVYSFGLVALEVIMGSRWTCPISIVIIVRGPKLISKRCFRSTSTTSWKSRCK